MSKYDFIVQMEGMGNTFNTYISSQEKELKKCGEYMEPGWFDFFVEPKLVLEIKDETRGKEGKCQELTLEDILTRKDNVVITGEPGIGKSSFLRWTGIHLCQNYEQLGLLPVHVHLINYSGNLEDDFQKAIGKCDSKLVDPDYRGYDQLSVKLKDGKVVFLFDALDEAGKIEQVSEEIKKLKTSREYGNNRFIISIRTNIYAPSLLGDFVELKMQPFTEDQIKTYLKQKLGGNKAIQDRLHGDAQLMDLCKLPLMLRFITEVQDLEGITNKAKLYERFIDQRFLTREEREKRSHGKYAPTKIDILAELAYHMQTDKEVIADYGGRRISTFLGDNLLLDKAGKHNHLTREDVQRVVDEIKANGLLIKEGREVSTYRFLHLTIQEYLSARAIKMRVTDEIVPFSSGVEKMSIKEFMDKHVRYEDKTFS